MPAHLPVGVSVGVSVGVPGGQSSAPAQFAEQAAYGLKAICITPANPAAGLDTHQGIVLLSDGQTGEPLAVLNASAVTEVRTAAVSVLATDLLARPGAGDLAVIGTGVQARAHIRAAARELDSATVADAVLFADSRESLLAEAGDYLLAVADGLAGPGSVRAELGEILTGAAPGRASDAEITIFESLGLAVEDLAAAMAVYQAAAGRAAGQWVEF